MNMRALMGCSVIFVLKMCENINALAIQPITNEAVIAIEMLDFQDPES